MVFYGLDWVATVPPTVAIVGQTFPTERAGVVYGWVFASHQLGAAAAAYAAGATRTSTGSYELAFHVAGALCIVAAGAVMFIRTRRAPTTGLPEAAEPVAMAGAV
jgi:sugar phosphate permease